MRVIAIDYRVDETWESIVRFSRDLLPLLSAGSHGCMLDLTGCRYMGPWAACIIYAYVSRARQLGAPVQLALPSEPPALRAYCEYSGLEHYLLKGPRPRQDHPDNETVPLNQFYQVAANLGYPITELVARHISPSEESEYYLHMSIREVCQNIEDHSESQIGGVWSGRFLRNRHEVRIAVVDMGLGISRVLSRKVRVASEVHALELVFAGGHSSRSRQSNMGLGISNLVNAVEILNGRLALVSGAAVGRVEGGRRKFESLDFRFPGTGVFFTLPVTHDDTRYRDDY